METNERTMWEKSRRQTCDKWKTLLLIWNWGTLRVSADSQGEGTMVPLVKNFFERQMTKITNRIVKTIKTNILASQWQYDVIIFYTCSIAFWRFSSISESGLDCRRKGSVNLFSCHFKIQKYIIMALIKYSKYVSFFSLTIWSLSLTNLKCWQLCCSTYLVWLRKKDCRRISSWSMCAGRRLAISSIDQSNLGGVCRWDRLNKRHSYNQRSSNVTDEAVCLI